MRSALLAIFVALFVLTPGWAGAESPPLYDGAMTFHAIQGPEGPEEYSWEVNLGANQALREVDDREAEVYQTDPEHHVFSITAAPAHDVDGTNVPTTLSVTLPNIITLTVHHRSEPFDYPVVQGSGWEGGFQTHIVEGPPGEVSPPPPTCVVPDLTGRSLQASRRLLHRSHCRLGAVRGEQLRTAHVVKQYRQIGKSLPLWTRVDVKALTGLQYVRAS